MVLIPATFACIMPEQLLRMDRDFVFPAAAAP